MWRIAAAMLILLAAAIALHADASAKWFYIAGLFMACGVASKTLARKP